jgi:hypothetical protein
MATFLVTNFSTKSGSISNILVKNTAMYKYTFCTGVAVIFVLLGAATDNRMAMANDIQSPIASNIKSQKDLESVHRQVVQVPVTNGDSTEISFAEHIAVSAQKRNEISHALDYYYESIQGSLRTQIDRL